jgi:putative membrane protein
MHYLTVFLVALVAVEHLYILILEMFMWTKPRTRKIFAMEEELAQKTTHMAANQGLYNGFLAAGLLFGLLNSNDEFAQQLQIFFLSCVIVAAIYGCVTVKKSIIFVQGLPAVLALLSVFVLG